MDELIGLVEQAATWQKLMTAVLVFSVCPTLLLHLAVLAYPPNHPRRKELVNELQAVPLWRQPFWAGQMIIVAVFEAVPLRRTRRKQRKASDPFAAAKDTIFSAIGALVLVAVMQFVVRFKLVDDLSSLEIVRLIIDISSVGASVAAVAMIVWGGLRYITALATPDGGQPESSGDSGSR